MNTLIKNASIITCDGGRVIDSGCIFIQGSVIKYVGTENITDIPKDTQVIDASGMLAMPVLINAHTHSPMTLFRGAADDMPLQKWLFERIFPMEAKLTDEHIYYGSMLSIAEMIAGGTTAFNDMYFMPDMTAKAIQQSGIRAVITHSMDGINLTGQERQFKLDRARRVFEQYNNSADGRITVSISPHAEYTCDFTFLKECAQLAEELNAMVHTHVSETQSEHSECIGRHGKTPVEVFEAAGLLKQNALLAHCTYITKQDMQLIRSRNATVLHNPGSNLKLGSGIAPVIEMQQAGVNIALGTDGAASNNNLDMFEEIRLAATLHKGVNRNATAVGAYDAVKMATVNGAKALSIDAGMIKAGKKADIILVNTKRPHMQPLHNAVNNTAYSAQASDVYLTMADGNILYKDGEFMTIDIDKVIYHAAKLAKSLV